MKQIKRGGVCQRRIILLVAAALLVACGGSDSVENASEAPEDSGAVDATRVQAESMLQSGDTAAAETEYRLPTGCILTGHLSWSNGYGGGETAVLQCGGTFIDSVDVTFGVYQVGQDSLVYNEIEDGVAGAIILRTGPTEVALRSLLPYLDDWFSQAVVYGTSLVYWGLSGPGEAMRRYAMRYEFPTGRLDSLFLDETEMLTGNRGYLDWPRRDGDDYKFEEYRVHGDTWKLLQNR